jgi:ABC-type uncharacterized transport system substrate-binding protein
MGIEVQSLEVRRPEDFESVFDAATRQRPDALITVEDPLTFNYRSQIVNFAATKRLPAIHGFREFVEIGGLMSYGASRAHLYRQTAIYVDKILRGANPADLPVHQPREFELVINLKAATALGLTIPPSINGPCRRGDRMKRRDFIAALSAAIRWPAFVSAQQPANIARIGYLANDSIDSPRAADAQ